MDSATRLICSVTTSVGEEEKHSLENLPFVVWGSGAEFRVVVLGFDFLVSGLSLRFGVWNFKGFEV